MKSDEEIFGNLLINLSVIILRKIDFFNIYTKELAATVEESEIYDITPRILDILATMDSFLFMSKEELDLGTLIDSTQLGDLDREKIGNEISRLLGY
jgi:hypothetical protein